MENTITAPLANAAPKKPAKRKKPAKLAKKSVSIAARPPVGLAKVPNLPERIETLLMQGDLTGLSIPERLQFYNTLCRTLELNPLTRPFEYIVFTDREQE